MKDGDKLLEQIKKELAWAVWFQLLKSTKLPDREYFRELIGRLTISKN